MPVLVARAHEEGGAADGRADGAVVDQRRRLVGAAEEGVGRRADAQACSSAASMIARPSATLMPSGFSE